jgi:TetR/AcrR family transcriptional regulator, transcriptional repressor for nem operon
VPQGRKRERKVPEVRRQEILDGAATLFIRQGLEGTSMAEVAEAAGVAKGTPYLYFDSKEELVAALRDAYLRDWYETAEALLDDPPSGQEWRRLEEFVQAMYQFHEDKVELHHLLLSSEGAEDEILARIRKLLSDFLGVGADRGAFGPADPRVTVDFILHGLHGILVDYLHQGRSAGEFAEAAMLVMTPLLAKRADR